MDQIMKPIMKSQNIHSINIFVNLDDVIHTLHKPLINLEFQTAGINSHKQLIMNIMNLLAHYRQWCIKQGLQCKIYGIYTNALSGFKNNMYVSEYRKKFKLYMDETSGEFYFINEAIRNSIQLLNIIGKHVDGVYIINSKYIEPSAVPWYIQTDVNKADWNIIISRDLYDLQYAYKDKWTVIAPKGDMTICVNNTNIWDYIRYKEHFEDTTPVYYDPELFIMVYSLSGDKYRNIPRLRKLGWKTLFKFLEDAYATGNTNTITMQRLLLNLLNSGKADLTEQLNKNLAATNIELQCNNLSEIDKSIVMAQMIDMPDPNALMELNRTYFQQYQINTVFLTTAEVKPRTPFG